MYRMMNYTYKGNEQRKLIQKCFHDQEIVLFLCEIDKYNEVYDHLLTNSFQYNYRFLFNTGTGRGLRSKPCL